MPRKAKSKSKGSKYSTKRKIKSSKSKSSRKNKTRNYESDSSESFMKQLVNDMEMTTEQSVGGFDMNMQQPMMNNMMQQPMNHGIDPLMVDEFAPLDNNMNMNNVMSGMSYQQSETMPMQMPQMMSPQMPQQMPQMMSPQMPQMMPQQMPQMMPQQMPQMMPQQMPQMMGGSRREHKRIMRNIRRFFS